LLPPGSGRSRGARIDELLAVDGVLATRLELADKVATSALDGPTCREPERVREVDLWIKDEFGDREGVRVVAYGDSAGDRELLADADEAH
jgi:phosphatidylglycerophosphatase C